MSLPLYLLVGTLSTSSRGAAGRRPSLAKSGFSNVGITLNLRTRFGEFTSSTSEVPKISPSVSSIQPDTRAELSTCFIQLYPAHQSIIITGTASRQTLCSRFPPTFCYVLSFPGLNDRLLAPWVRLVLWDFQVTVQRETVFGSSEDPAFGVPPHTPIR
jgi:hypothetical protein